MTRSGASEEGVVAGDSPPIVNEEDIALHILVEAVNVLEAVSDVPRVSVQENEGRAVLEATLLYKPRI